MNNYYERKSPSGLILMSKEERQEDRIPYQELGCCNLHCMPTTESYHCEDYRADTGGGIMISICKTCWYYNDRMVKYEKIEKEQICCICHENPVERVYYTKDGEDIPVCNRCYDEIHWVPKPGERGIQFTDEELKLHKEGMIRMLKSIELRGVGIHLNKEN